MIWWIIGAIVAFFVFRFLWRGYKHPASVLGKQAANMNWIAIGRIEGEEGFKDVCYERDGVQVKVSYANGQVFLINPPHTESFKDFIKLEHWLANYFGRNNLDISKETQTSRVRFWAEMKKEEMERRVKLKPEFLFDIFMYAISRFGKNWSSLSVPPKYADNPYSGDSSIFEIGCYFYTNIDIWLFDNKPEMREQLSGYLCQRFVNLFSEALTVENVQDLFFERVEKYTELFRNYDIKDIKKILLYLIELVKRTINNTPPQKADFDNFKLSGDHDEISNTLTAYLGDFVVKKVPLMLEAMESYVSKLEVMEK